MEPILSFDSVSFSYHSVKGETPAVADLSFSVQEGEFAVLVGPSGCGKAMVLQGKPGIHKISAIPESNGDCPRAVLRSDSGSAPDTRALDSSHPIRCAERSV